MHMRMAGMASTIIQTRHNEFDLSQVPVWQFAARYEQANDAEDHPTPDGGLVALGNIRRNPPRLIQKIKRPPQVGGLRDSKSPIPPEKNGLTTGQSFRQNTVQARAIKCLPNVSHSLCLTGNRPLVGFIGHDSRRPILRQTRAAGSGGRACRRIGPAEKRRCNKSADATQTALPAKRDGV